LLLVANWWPASRASCGSNSGSNGSSSSSNGSAGGGGCVRGSCPVPTAGTQGVNSRSMLTPPHLALAARPKTLAPPVFPRVIHRLHWRMLMALPGTTHQHASNLQTAHQSTATMQFFNK
jgi:hypothetical protein